VRKDRGAGALRRATPILLAGACSEPGRIGVQAEADLAAALVDERREPIREGLFQTVSRP
jgi:hypothetical protein